MLIRFVCIGAALLLLGQLAYAADGTGPAQIQLRNQVPAGERPSVALTAVAPLSAVRMELTREQDGRRFTATHGALRPGESATLTVGDGRPGRARWQGTLILTLPDGGHSLSKLTFETSIGGGGGAGGLKVTYRRDHLDLDAHKLEFQLSRPAAQADVHVFGEDGVELGSGSATFAGEPAGAWLPVHWTQPSSSANVLRIELRATASDGSAVQVKLIPWSVRIPHEEVVFATGQSTIAPSEVAKLEASHQRIADVVARVRAAEPSLPVHLYVAGHTDTVGAPEDNRKLSLARARAIGSWFRDKGLAIAVSYAGFGEDALKVKTPDNTDEAANRRADYIVGVEEPLVARGVRAQWYSLK